MNVASHINNKEELRNYIFQDGDKVAETENKKKKKKKNKRFVFFSYIMFMCR